MSKTVPHTKYSSKTFDVAKMKKESTTTGPCIIKPT